jgi:hypothetical protein
VTSQQIPSEQLLWHLEELVRTMPNAAILGDDSDESASWRGRACALVERWNGVKCVIFRNEIDNFISLPREYRNQKHYKNMLTTLHQARSDLQLQTSGPMSVPIPTGGVYSYFDEIRKIIQTAKQDLLFVDPYLDADFVSNYLPYVSSGTHIRLLTNKKLSTLLPAVSAFKLQNGSVITVKSSRTLHDRFVFVDGLSCYQSGASFKDGGKFSPTTLTQVTDAFTAVKQTYESLWSAATTR